MSATFHILSEFDGQTDGPFNFAQLCELIEKRKLKKNSLVARSGTSDWNEAGIVLKKLFDKVEQKKFEAKQAKELEKRKAKLKAEDLKAEKKRSLAKARESIEERNRSIAAKKRHDFTLSEVFPTFAKGVGCLPTILRLILLFYAIYLIQSAAGMDVTVSTGRGERVANYSLMNERLITAIIGCTYFLGALLLNIQDLLGLKQKPEVESQAK